MLRAHGVGANIISLSHEAVGSLETVVMKVLSV
jgi:hypothetical protein